MPNKKSLEYIAEQSQLEEAERRLNALLIDPHATTSIQEVMKEYGMEDHLRQ